MTAEEKESFASQVLEVIQRQNASEDYNYYGHFINECQRYGLTEDDFNKQILVVASKRYDGPIEPTSGPNCLLFGTRCYSIKKMGEMFFNFPSKCEEYMADATLLREDLRRIENTDRTLELLAVFNSEKAVNRRYIRIMYHFNPSLPYRIGTELSANLPILLQKGFQDYKFYEQVVYHFSIGFIQIWLQETDKLNAAKLNGGTGYIDFLKFVYAVDKTYPFYLKDLLYLTPADLAAAAQKSAPLREILYEYMYNGQVPVWFNSTGKPDWNDAYQEVIAKVIELPDYDEQDQRMAAVQSLIQIIDPSIPPPKIISATQKISLLAVEASKPVQQPIVFTLQNTGILKGIISLDNNVEGITLNQHIISFNSFTGSISETIVINIDPLYLEKDVPYNIKLSVTAINETTVIPVIIKIVFPAKAYSLLLLKYGFFGIVYFIIIRSLLALCTNNARFYYPYIPSFYSVSYSLPSNYPVYIIIFMAMIFGLFGLNILTKKVEEL